MNNAVLYNQFYSRAYNALETTQPNFGGQTTQQYFQTISNDREKARIKALEQLAEVICKTQNKSFFS